MTVVNDVADKEIKKALSVLTKNIIIATSQSKQEGLKFYIQEAVRDAIPNIREAFLMKLVREEIKDLTKNLLLSELNEIKVEYANMGKALSGINANDIVAEFDLMHAKNPFRLFKNPIWFCQNYCKKRWSRSNLRKFYFGLGLDVEEADGTVNTLTLVNALVLTIPYSLIGSLSMSYWDQLRSAFDEQCGDTDHSAYNFTYLEIVSRLYGVVFSSVTSMCVACFYYILRPKDDEIFPKWWKRGKYTIGFIFLGCVASVSSVLIMLSSLVPYYSNSTDNICNTTIFAGINNKYRQYSQAGYFIIVIVMIVSILLMI